MTQTDPAFEHLLAELYRLYAHEPALAAFAALPAALMPQPITPVRIPPAALMESDPDLTTTAYAAIRDAFIAAGAVAQWRLTYQGSRLGADFMDRFGCYCLIGEGGPFTCDGLAAYVVYMPAGLYYPFHQHPAEEIYFILAGEAEFLMEGHPPRRLGPGDHVFHPSGRAHATRTHDRPFMALVLWRGDLETAPVLTYPEGEI